MPLVPPMTDDETAIAEVESNVQSGMPEVESSVKSPTPLNMQSLDSLQLDPAETDPRFDIPRPTRPSTDLDLDNVQPTIVSLTSNDRAQTNVSPPPSVDKTAREWLEAGVKLASLVRANEGRSKQPLSSTTTLRALIV